MRILWQQSERAIYLDIEIQPDGLADVKGSLRPYQRKQFREQFLPHAPNNVWRDAYIIYLVQFSLIYQQTHILDQLLGDWQFTRTTEGFELKWHRKQKPGAHRSARSKIPMSKNKPNGIRQSSPKPTRPRIWVRFVQGGAPGLGKRA